MQPINAFGMDAAIIFADILPPLIGMGFELEFVKGKGPVIYNPIDTTFDIDMLATPPATETLNSTLEAIKQVKVELGQTPLIGFAGAPFTLASYAIEGGSSRTYIKTKQLMYSQPAAWKRLMDKLVTVQADYLIQQAKAGADALQLFDSWAGLALGASAYRDYIQPYNTKLFEMVKRAGVPTINFSTGTGAFLGEVVKCGGNVLSIDWRTSIQHAWQVIEAEDGGQTAVQGNLDPITLLAPWRELKFRVDEVLADANGRSGYIFNLGHGIVPQTPIDNVRRVIDYVHEKTST